MRTLQLEFVAEKSSTIAARLDAAGVSILAGHEPVPMRGRGAEPDTIVVTVLVPSGIAANSLHRIPGVLRVLGDVHVAALE